MKPIKFIHVADLHLGKKQYNLEERYKDFFRAFKWILNHATKEEVDFILIAGDLFDNKNINPKVLSDVFYIIRDFKNECQEKLNRDIPLICIEGNHDNPIYTSRSWMSFLADLDLVILLSGEHDKEKKKIVFQPFSREKHRGGMIRMKDTCIYGLPYYGSYSQYLFPLIQEALPQDDSTYNILMMHFGIEGYDPTKPGVKMNEDLIKLHDKIDYLGLGHYHKQYGHPEKNPWIYNPGSLEINDIRELKHNHGAIFVEVSGKEPYQRDIRPINISMGGYEPDQIPNRLFTPIPPIDISECKSFEDSILLILERVKTFGVPLIDSSTRLNKASPDCMILILLLKGEINYSRLEINLNKLREQIIDKFAILDARIFTKDLYSTLDSIKISDEDMSIDDIEKEIFLALIDENDQFKPIKTEITALMDELKSELLQKKPNYGQLKERIKEWAKINIKEVNTSKKERIHVEIKTLSTALKDKKPEKKIEQEKVQDAELSKDMNHDDDFDLDLDDYIDSSDDDLDEEV